MIEDLSTILVSAVSLVVAGIIFIIAGSFYRRAGKKIEGKFKRVTATCVGHEPDLASSYTTDVVPVLKYKHRGKDYFYVPNTGFGGPTPLRAKRTLYINPSNPKECYSEDYFEEIGGLAWFGIVLVILGFVFLVIDLFI